MNTRATTITLCALLGGTAIYLACDVWVWHGPLHRLIETANQPTSPVVACVFDTPITRSQLERAISTRLWLAGNTADKLTPEQRRQTSHAALEELIDHELLRAKVTANAAALVVSDAEINARMDRFAGRFDSPDAMAGTLKAQGIAGGHDLRARLAAQIQQEKYIESLIGPAAAVTAAEARQWFAANQPYLTNKERVEVRHIFIPTLDYPPEQARAKLAAALAALTSGAKDFATLAGELSEDPASSASGGTIGWMTRERLPADFAAPVFALATNKPALVRTHLGWHLVEVTARRPAEPQTFEQAQPEILAALAAIKRRDAITKLRTALRESAAADIKMLDEP